MTTQDKLAQLAKTFTYGGGQSTAPISNEQQIKEIPTLSQSGKQNPLARLAETFSYDTKVEIPKTQPKAVPSIAQPSFDYESVIKEYESLPSTNILSRLFSKDSRDAYNRKQELNPQYEQAKDAQTRKRLSDLGLSENEVRNAYNLDFGNGGYYLPQLLKKAGVTDKKEYNDLYSALDKMFTRTAQSEANERNIKLADEHPVIGSALTVPGKMLAGAGNAIESRVNYLTGNPLSNTSGSLAANKSMNEMRGAVSDDINGAGKFLYTYGMSMADMLANRWLLGNVGNLSMGFGKEADTMNEAIDQGLNPTQIMGKGLASGATTYITEKMLTTKSLDAAKESILNLLKEGGLKALGKGGIVKVLLPILAKSGVAEGTQEGLENIADTIADVFIAGGKNELTQSYNQYKANGLSNDEALKKVAGDKALELLEDTAGGFLSGFVMGGAEMGKSGIEYKLNNRNTSLPTLEQQTEQSIAPIKGGKATTIQNPYNGTKPVQNIEGRNRITIPSENYDDANTNLEVSNIDSQLYGRSQRKILSKVYKTLFGTDESKTSFDVPVNGTSIEDKPYVVTVNKNAIDKICSDPNMSAEKLAVIDNLSEVIKNAEFIDSGNYQNYKNLENTKNVTRYDYFETDANIGGQDFVVSFDVEVVPGHNNYRTHKVINEINLIPTSGETGPVPAAQGVSGLSTQNIPQPDNSVKSEANLPTLDAQQTNTPVEGLTPVQKPKTYDTKNVSDKGLNRILNDHFKMFASNEEGTAIKDQLKQAINEYEDTLSNDALNRINALVQRSEEIMKNGNYEWKRDSGKRSEKVRHTTYPNYRGTVTDNVMTYIDNAKVKNELVNKANPAYRTEIKEMANTLTKANADISAWDSLSEVKESFDNYVKTGDETYLETAMTAVEEMARSADISYSQVQKAFENGLTNAMKAEENKSLPTVNKVMKEDVGINGRDEEIDDGPIRLVEPVGGGIPDIRTRNTYTSKVARNTLEKFYSQDEKTYQRLVDNVLEGKHQVELQQMKDTNSKAVERIEKYSPDTTMKIL